MKMQAFPLVSVYIPTHNRANLLRRAIDSVLAQHYKNIEVIVVDDGSTDETPEMISGYTNQGLITYLRNDSPLGACLTRNRAIEAANGKYITGLDDDDYFLPTRIETFVNAIRPEDAFLCSNYQIQHSATKRRTIMRTARDIRLKHLLQENLVGNQIFTHTAYLLELGGFDPEMPAWQDYELWLRVAEHYGSGRRLPEATYIIDKSHEHERISSNYNKLESAFSRLTDKHDKYMTPKNRQSIAFSLREYSHSFSLVELLPYLATPLAARALKLYLVKKRNALCP